MIVKNIFCLMDLFLYIFQRDLGYVRYYFEQSGFNSTYYLIGRYFVSQ